MPKEAELALKSTLPLTNPSGGGVGGVAGRAARWLPELHLPPPGLGGARSSAGGDRSGVLLGGTVELRSPVAFLGCSEVLRVILRLIPGRR